MPMDFPTIESLTFRAKQRGFRQPKEGETAEQYRSAFADFMLNVDSIEAMEIRSSMGWDRLFRSL